VPVIPFMRPVTEPPPAGKPIQLFLKDGRTRAATTSLVFMGNECFFMWYDAKTRKSIAVDKIKGWAPAQLA